ncbi:kinase-like domain-containing protein [Crucibulum laeve]|uniref:Kinase-like domain-containing protein n=1 Tax=Crucibulum laeve TaxID=68775 RepID=A0A5C3M9P8_9AGAR|nr:kinase-like domain-containing protein [Crucibulum laeve]
MTTGTTTQQPDLTTEDSVLEYLSATPFASTSVNTLSGGGANYTYRIHLITPYEGNLKLVLKHAAPYVKSIPTLAFDVNRQLYEAEAMKRVKAMLPRDAIVTVPTVHLHDKEANVMIMDDCGEDTIHLKEFMQVADPSVELSSKIGTLIGEFAGRLHAWGKNNTEVYDYFEGNQQAKRISSWAYYGRLLGTLTGEGHVPKLADPQLEVRKEDLEVLGQVVQDMTQAMLSARDAFVMGDFWPGNMVVSLDENKDLKRIYVVDWELAKPGLLGVEIGQFCAEVHFLRRFIPKCQNTASALLANFLKRYAQIITLSEEECKRAIVHCGTHMVVIGSTVDWGEKEITREVAMEGVDLIVRGYTADESWLKGSLVGPLLSK